MSVTAPERQVRGQQRDQEARPRRPFIVGTRTVSRTTYDQTKVMTTSSQAMTTYECDPNGFLSDLYIEVVGTSTASAAVVFGEDGPFAVLEDISLNDTNNKPILGPLSGWDLYVLSKYGGYTFSDDARNDSDNFSTATSGSFAFILRLPVELVHRDALGSLPNKSSSATYDLAFRLTAAAAGSTFNNVQNALPSVRVRVQQEGWMDPNPVDTQGNPTAQNPPGVQSTQYWTKQTYTLAFGSVFQRLQSIDSFIRTLVFVWRDSSASSGTGSTSPRGRGDTNHPDPFTLQYETSQPVNLLRSVWRRQIIEQYGYIAAPGTAAQEAANARDKGVYPISFARDFGHKVGGESRFGYLPASAATTINITGTQGSNGTGPGVLTILVNKVVPAGGNPLALTGR
jgi:hypothetical protein